MRIEFMEEALSLARQAAAAGEVPVGCVVVRDGSVIGRAHNLRETMRSALAHAETLAIGEACRNTGDWRLSDCELYVTLEPCIMCAGAIISAKIPKVYFGARDPEAGACGSVLDIFSENFRHSPELVGGILAGEASELLSEFFSGLRRRRSQNVPRDLTEI